MTDTALSDPVKLLAERLEEARQSAHLTQAEAAADIGCSPRSYQDYEAARAWPRPGMRRKLLAFIEQHGKRAA